MRGGSVDRLGFLIESGHYQILLFKTIGKRMGVGEHLTVIDTRKKEAEIDNLIVCRDCQYSLASETFLDLPYEVVARKQEGRPIFIETLREWLEEQLLVITDPEKTEKMEKVIAYFKHPDDMLQASSSVLTVKFANTRNT
jgi:hypothetical protein